MIKVTQKRPTDASKDRFKIETTDVLAIFMAEAADIEDMPLKPNNNMHGHEHHKFGPWVMYLAADKAKQFVEEVGFFTHEAYDEKGMAHQITLDLTYHKFGNLQDGKASEKMIELETAHVLVVVPAGPLVALLDKNAFKLAWQHRGFVVVKSNQEGMKIQGKRLKGSNLNRFHFNLKHMECELAMAPWPFTLDLQVKGTTQHLEYTIFGHPELNGKVCLKYCHRPTMEMAQWFPPTVYRKICPGTCELTNRAKNQAPPSRGEGTAETMLAEKLKKTKEDAAMVECANFTIGACLSVGRGKVCKYLHAGLPGDIDCRIMEKKYCTPKCLYKHGSLPPPGLGHALKALNSKGGSSSMNGPNDDSMDLGISCKWTHMFLHKPRLNHRKGKWYSYPTSMLDSLPEPRRTKPHMTYIWDSTLGYPGEGHPLRLLGMNVNGLNDPKVVGKLLRQAKQLRVDVIFLQEHNMTRLKARDLEFLVGKKGWKAAISTAGLTPRSSRGGTAVLVREDIPGHTEFHVFFLFFAPICSHSPPPPPPTTARFGEPSVHTPDTFPRPRTVAAPPNSTTCSKWRCNFHQC